MSRSPSPRSGQEPGQVLAARDQGAVAFDLPRVEAAIAGTAFAGHLHYLASTASTNTLALAAAQENVATGVWVAGEQTAGRGRGGHAWHSPAFVDGHPAGLYVSVLVRPRLFGADALKLSLAAGLAAKSAIAEACGVDIDLRWPNDLMLADANDAPAHPEKKFGGILTESSIDGGSSAALAYAVIGIGMNLNHTTLPGDLSSIATSLCLVMGHPVPRETILAALLRHLEAEIHLIETEAAGHTRTLSICTRFERASSWVRNLRVHVGEQGGYTGVTAGLDPQGLLRVRLDDGSTRTVRHGGVRRALTNS